GAIRQPGPPGPVREPELGLGLVLSGVRHAGDLEHGALGRRAGAQGGTKEEESGLHLVYFRSSPNGNAPSSSACAAAPKPAGRSKAHAAHPTLGNSYPFRRGRLSMAFASSSPMKRSASGSQRS